MSQAMQPVHSFSPWRKGVVRKGKEDVTHQAVLNSFEIVSDGITVKLHRLMPGSDFKAMLRLV
jgi:hypothetical protein